MMIGVCWLGGRIQMSEQYNPFKENRTEQMKDLWKYYVPFPGLGGDGKPLVVEGGRGSGKTMFFQCNSWRQKLLQLMKNEKPVTDLLDEEAFVGIYYRVDTTFVSSMRGREEEYWELIFGTYLSICILKEILELISVISLNVEIEKSKLEKFVEKFSKKLDRNSTVNTIETFYKECDIYLDIIEDKINGVSDAQQGKLRYVNTHRFITDLCVECCTIFERDNIMFKIFIDEYETLQEYQQKIINTLIKHSSLPVIFNIGLRPKGMKTLQTVSDTETIEAPHDYEYLPLGFNEERYPQIIKDICRIRIALGKESGQIPASAPEDIEYYLGNYSIDYEIEKISQSLFELPHLKKLQKLIHERGKQEGLTLDEVEKYCNILCYDAPIINSRMHYALLCKQTSYTPSIKDLAEEYSGNTKRYNEWYHNRKFGTVFLLCKETKREKLYYGFDVYSALSSNIVRYFLELCEHAFKIAFLNGYNWDGPIVPDMQSEAARYVSEYKVIDIAGYEPFGKELRIFTQYLGQIFYKLHTDEDLTLGEPEPNHFNTKDLSLSDECRKMISSCIMWNVLQEGEATKKKQSKLSPETVDYYLNKIYVPYFGISYRNQRKIQISVEILNDLFSGEEKKAIQALRKFFKQIDNDEDKQLSFLHLITGE